MTCLISGLVIFFAAHIFPWFPARRDAAIARFGLVGYWSVSGLVTACGFALIVYGYATAERTILWTAPEGARELAYIAVPIALCLAVAAGVGSNIKRFTAHPMLWSIAIWSAVHILNNGDVESLLLFGGFLIYAPAAMVSANMRGAAPRRDKVPLWRDALALVIGIGAAGLIAHFHQTLFGVAVL